MNLPSDGSFFVGACLQATMQHRLQTGSYNKPSLRE